MADEAAAAVLAAKYPSMQEAPVALAAPPANVAELREAQRPLTQAYPSMVEALGSSFVDDLETPPAQARQQRAEVTNLWNDVGATPDDVAYAVNAARGYAKSPPTADQVAEMQRAAKSQLREVYGDGAHEALVDAKALAGRDPRFAALLNATGLGNDPTMVLKLAALARQQRLRGRL